MKIFTVCLAFAFIPMLSAQSHRLDSLVNLQPVYTKKVIVEDQNFIKVYVPSSFAEAEIRDTSNFSLLRATQIISVDLVYTKYRQSETFAQKELNRARLEHLQEIFPDAFNDFVYWTLIEQTEANDTAEAATYFHGFIFTIQPKLELTIGETELAYFDSVMEKLETTFKPSCMDEIERLTKEKQLPSPPQFGVSKLDLKNYLLSNIKIPKTKWFQRVDGNVDAYFYVAESGIIDSVVTVAQKVKPAFEEAVDAAIASMPPFNPSKLQTGNVQYSYKVKIGFDVRGKWHRKFSVTALKPTLIPICSDSAESFTAIDYSSLYLPDSTILSVLNRNYNWKDMLIVCDFTGSMSPYTTQLLVWYKLMLNSKEQRVKYFCFFNDGDNKPDSKKKIGSTGGIYCSKALTMDEMKDMAKKTMTNGSGGDVQENNVEALITAMKTFPDATEIVLVADNFATPRDLILLNKLSKPMKIVLCGSQFGINVEYLNFAKQTGSTLHTINEDIVNLSDMKDGERITIDGVSYEFINGSFRKVTGS